MRPDNLLKFKLHRGDSFILINKYNIIYIVRNTNHYEILVKIKENLTEVIHIDLEYYQDNYLND